MLRAGVSKLDITPPVGVRMAGFSGRVFPSLAVHDPLWARALVLDDGERRGGLIALDLLGVSEETVSQVRAEAAASLDIAPQGLLIAGTHTHSGPERTSNEATKEQAAYWNSLPVRLCEVLSEAAANLVPAAIGAGSGWSAVGINRRQTTRDGTVVLGRDHFGIFDTELGLIRVDRADGRPLAGVMNYACHAVCLMADNYLTSADYPGFAVHGLERAIGDGVTAIFVNGACGDVNPREAAAEEELVSGGSFTIAERAGSMISREAARVWRGIQPSAAVELAFRQRRIELPTNRARAILAAEESLKRAEENVHRPVEEPNPYLVWHNPPDPEEERRRVESIREQGDTPVPCEIQAICLGETTLLGWPGEVFSSLGMAAKRGSPFAQTYVVGYANGSIGYVPTPEAFAEGGYEARCALHLADHAGEVLVEESLDLLQELRR